MKYIKVGVTFTPCSPELVDGIITTALIYDRYKAALVVTSGSDGVHPAGGATDPHYLGYAFDARIRDLDESILPLLVVDLREALGPQWRVVVEPNHLHCQNQGFHNVKSR